MNGTTLKRLMRFKGFTNNDMAQRLGTTAQNFPHCRQKMTSAPVSWSKCVMSWVSVRRNYTAAKACRPPYAGPHFCPVTAFLPSALYCYHITKEKPAEQRYARSTGNKNGGHLSAAPQPTTTTTGAGLLQRHKDMPLFRLFQIYFTFGPRSVLYSGA